MVTCLKTSVAKLNLENPVIVASGVCGFGEENVGVLNKCGAVVFKTVTFEPRSGNPTPRVVDFSYGMLNSIGLENPGVENLIEKIKYIKRVKTIKIASLLGYTDEEFVVILKKLEEYKIFDAYELNLSCPNVEKGRWFYDKKILAIMLRNLREATKKPLIAKLTPEIDIEVWVKIVVDCGIDAVTLFNTYTGIAVDYEKRKFRLANKYGGYSGPGIKPLVQRWVYDIGKNFNIDIIACGGVLFPRDVIEYLLLGAKAVQIGSGYFRNPQLPVECIKFLTNYLKKEKLTLDQIVGALK
ncbi:MAG: dihydroorotate dehydrogenase [Endomicrobia bacterium]|nr:dihydroorotate dehydrogenase [Endomicrobiia bacterium]